MEKAYYRMRIKNISRVVLGLLCVPPILLILYAALDALAGSATNVFFSWFLLLISLHGLRIVWFRMLRKSQNALPKARILQELVYTLYGFLLLLWGLSYLNQQGWLFP